MSLDVDVHHRQGSFLLDAQFKTDGRLTALFGRSGSGKTTIVNAIGGLIQPSGGKISIDGRVLFDSQKGLSTPTHRRRIGYVFQESRLFPHLNVRQNLLFGRWFTPRISRLAIFDDVVSLLGIDGILERRPSNLSGGEKQRVAIGRALLADPELLLMDEPLAPLDEERKEGIYPYIERIRDEARVPIVYVTHSVPEIVRLATSIVILEAGRVAAAGPTSDIMRDIDLFPAFGVGEAGVVLEARVHAHDRKFGLTALNVRAGILTVPLAEQEIGAALLLRVRARDVILATEAPSGLSALNVLPGRVMIVAEGATSADVTLDCGGDALVARLTRKSVHELGIRPGLAVHAIIKGIAFEGGNALNRASPLSKLP